MDGNGNGLSQIFRMISAMSVVMTPAGLDCGDKAGAVQQKRRVMPLKAWVTAAQVTDFIAQICGLNLSLFGRIDCIDFSVR